MCYLTHRNRSSNGKMYLLCIKTCLPLTSLMCENVSGSPSAFQMGVQRSCTTSLHVEEGEPGTEATCDVCIYITVHIVMHIIVIM